MPNYFSKAAEITYILTNSWHSQDLWLFNFCQYGGYKMVFQCGFNLHFPDFYKVVHLSIYLLAFHVSSLVKWLYLFPIFLLGCSSFYYWNCIVRIFKNKFWILLLCGCICWKYLHLVVACFLFLFHGVPQWLAILKI